MGKPTGFIEIQRKKHPTRPVAERVNDWREVYLPYPKADLQMQGARCMDCGIPFCHQGCPLGNLIPDWNDFVYRDRWQAAIERLGAVREGVVRHQYIRPDGTLRDTVLYSVVPEEWPAVRAHLRARLAAHAP